MSVLTELPRIVILASGQGSLAAALMESAHFFEVAAVISDRREAPVLGRAEAAGINAISLPIQGDRLAWESALADQVAAFAPEFVVSAGFRRILSPRFLERFRVINSHPSLLPDFPGAHAVRDALAAGASESGCTIHWVDEGVDTGKVIAQRIVEVIPGDTETSLHERIKVVERELLVSVVEALVRGE